MDVRSAEIDGAPQETIKIHRAPITSAAGALALSTNGGIGRAPQPIRRAARFTVDCSRRGLLPMRNLLFAITIVWILALLGGEAAALSSGALVFGLAR
jgi:hypothetical protein